MKINSCNSPYYQSLILKKKLYDYSSQLNRKGILQNPTSSPLKNSQKTRNKSGFPHPERSNNEETTANVKFNDERFPYDQEQDQRICPHHFCRRGIEGSVQCIQDRKRNRKDADWQGRRKTVFILRWHDHWWQKSNETYKSY